MKDNATFIEFATFFFIIAFSVTMTKMQWDHTDNITQARIDQELKILNDADELIAWNDRVTRIQSVGAINHDGDPNTNLFDVVIDASSYVDPDKDFISYSWTYLNSWDNRYDKNQIFLYEEPLLSEIKKVDFSIEAGVHEFELSVTDSYGAETLEVVTIEVGGEPNKLPVGTARAYKKVN
tara:strand:+ start:121 stop:660 length:540 start_codon:yes stop_codon:yes gene_type:complete